MLVEGRHFLSTVAPERLGHKALAVNLSDLAACGAQPLAFTLALALPRADEVFLEGFRARPVRAGRCARHRTGRRRHHAGPAEHLHHRVRRGAARAGAAALGRARRRRPLRQRHGRRCAAGAGGVPRPARAGRRGVRVGARRDGAAAAARRARPGAARRRQQRDRRVRRAARRPRPRAAPLRRRRGGGRRRRAAQRGAGRADAWRWQRECTLAGGDDYELLFTAPPAAADAVQAAARRAGVAVTRIGRIEAGAALRLVDAAGTPVPHTFGSFDHFRS